MRSNATIPLRVIIPGLTFIFCVIFGAALMIRELDESERRMTEEMQRYASARSTTIAGMVQYMLRRNDKRGSELFISFASSDVNVQSVLVCNENNKIIYSNRYDLRGKQLEKVVEPEIVKQVEAARSSLSTTSSAAGKNDLYSISAFMLPPSSGEIRPTAVGCVVVDLDLAMIRNSRHGETFQRWIELAGLLLAFCITIWIVLHITLGKRVRRLAAAANQVGEGTLDIKIKVGGCDEIAYLARSLETMAADIKVNRDRLKTAYNEMEGRVKLRTADLEEARRKAYRLMQDANNQRQKAEEALDQLRKSQSELRTLSRAIEQSPAEVMIFDTTGRITYVNPAFTQITGYSAAEAIGRQPNFLSAQVQPDKDYNKLWNSIMDGNQWCGEFCTQKKNGDIFWEMVSISPVRDEQGNVTHFVAVKEDMTEQKRVAEELAKAKQAAESASQAKSAFLANMSHEIRTPMNIIIGMGHLALDTDLSKKQRDYVEKISGAARALLGIINDILDFSKIEAGKMSIEAQPFKLDDVINNATGLMGVRLEQKELELLIDIDRAVPLQLSGDSLRLTQILTNLLSNAIKFTDKGEIQLSVQLSVQTEERVELDFCIRDSGIGMTAELLNNLFKPFTQADSSTTRKYGGTGLGLAISKQLCELMGGWITAESEPDQGSTFRFHLPFGAVKEHVSRTQFNLSDDLKGMRVLVVDDNKAVRELIEKLLTSMGFHAESASDGADALQKIQNAQGGETEYELIILDWNMPTLDGIETGRRIRALKLASQPKLLMLTAYGHDEILYMAEEADFDECIHKPVHASTLFNTILTLFGKTPHVTQPDKHELKSVTTGAHILLVEDHEINQQVAVELLEKIGMTVTIAGNGAEAIELVNRHNFDLVLMDIQMPVMDGLTATRAIRKLPKPYAADLPILAMTAHAMSGDKEKSLAAGMNGHITKPIDPDELVKALNQWLPSSRPQAGPQTTGGSGATPHANRLNTIKALNRLGGNHTLYHQLLIRFVEENHDAGARLASALNQHDIKKAIRIAHSIKGVAGNLGAEEIYQHASQLETRLRSGEMETKGSLCSFNDSLKNTIKQIRQYQLSHPIHEKHNLPPGELNVLRDQLEELNIPLQKCTPKPCRTIMEKLTAKQWPADLALGINNLDRLISKYRFNEAKEALIRIKKTLDGRDATKGDHRGTQ